MSISTTFVNFNEYLGGGETLLLRMVEAFPHKNIKVLSSEGSYIHEQLKNNIKINGNSLMYSNDYNYNYLGGKDKEAFFYWLSIALPESDSLNVVTFCMRDLHLVVSFINKYKRKNIKLTHLLLHPLDHLYLGQTIFDKFLLKMFGTNRFNLNENISINTTVLRKLEISNSLIPMNYNVLKRIKSDTGIALNPEKIIPLPFCSINDCSYQNVSSIDNQTKTRIVWLGRIVDFKISAIKAMIDFISENQKFSFDIIGYGNEQIINNYIANKSVSNRVKIVGRIAHNQLKQKLSNYHVGYGMGTSMAELTLCGLPVIVALASPNFKSFKQQISAGLVYEQKPGNVGDDLYCTNMEEENFPQIIDSIRKIEKNTQDCLNRSLAYLSKNLCLEKNITRYVDVIESAPVTSFSKIPALRVNLLRKLLFKVLA